MAATLFLSSCSNPASDGQTEHLQTDQPVTTAQPVGYIADDVAFATNMIPHHQQAVKLSAMVPDRSTNAELIALALTGKQLHWNSYGRAFVGAHRYLDELVEEWREMEDLVAGRAAAIGIAPDGTARAVVELSALPSLEPGFTRVECAIERLSAQLWEVARRIRQRAELLSS